MVTGGPARRSTSLGVVLRPLAGGGTVVGGRLATAGGSTGAALAPGVTVSV